MVFLGTSCCWLPGFDANAGLFLPLRPSIFRTAFMVDDPFQKIPTISVEENNAANPVQMRSKEEGRDVSFLTQFLLRIINYYEL
jgi:hypothetical protein